ncbi:hypothetical protein GCM10009560_51220 [Nonomuraea longicatena]|uniref:Uncharacterized protein n=1 Tax=Nonomuraea longicatena TaxID=83682 RepID=A0ABN1QAU1_9ACTN
MLTAGHCVGMGNRPVSGGGMGTVTHDTFTSAAIDSAKVDGKYRSDLALIKMASGVSAARSIFVGGVNSTTGRTIAASPQGGTKWLTDSAAPTNSATGPSPRPARTPKCQAGCG